MITTFCKKFSCEALETDFSFQVNTQLYSAREKAELNHLIHVMIAYNMTYHQERTPEGQYTYLLDP